MKPMVVGDSMETLKLLEEQLQKFDKLIEREEKGLVHLNKQLGNKITKLKALKDERWKISMTYKQASRDAELLDAIVKVEESLTELGRS